MNIPTEIERQERILKVQMLKSQGYTYRQIASKLGFASINMVHRDLADSLKALKEKNGEIAEMRRDLIQEDFDELMGIIAPQLTKGVEEINGELVPIPNWDAIDRVIKIKAQEREMWGTDAPKRTEVEKKDVRDFGSESSRKQAFDRIQEKYGKKAEGE